MTKLRLVIASAVVVLLATAVACSSGGDDATPSDPVLAKGQQVYKQNCAQCHGAKGGGGQGPKLAGVVAANFPNIEDHKAVIANGREGMPSFKDRLTPEEIDAVARWEREGLQ